MPTAAGFGSCGCCVRPLVEPVLKECWWNLIPQFGACNWWQRAPPASTSANSTLGEEDQESTRKSMKTSRKKVITESEEFSARNRASVCECVNDNQYHQKVALIEQETRARQIFSEFLANFSRKIRTSASVWVFLKVRIASTTATLTTTKTKVNDKR